MFAVKIKSRAVGWFVLVSLACGFVPVMAQAVDPYYPQFGNQGYDAINYQLSADFTVRNALTNVSAECSMTGQATQNLASFDLDLIGLNVTAVTVNGAPARFTQTQAKLTVIPKRTIMLGHRFLVRTWFSGQPGNDGAGGGWTNTSDGGILVGDPFVAAYLLPVNDDPADKALFQATLTVPAGLTAASNGALRSTRRLTDGRSTWLWVESRPMVMHNIVIAVGNFEMTTARTKSGVKIWNFIDPSLPAEQLQWARYGAKHIPDYLQFLSAKFGPYPFSSAGMIADNAYLGYAMESQERPFYAPGWFRRDPSYVFIHELAHQWFACSVSPAHYADTWLNEGFATFAEFLYDEYLTNDGTGTQPDFDFYWSLRPDNFPHGSRRTSQQAYSNLWDPIVADPGADPDLLFSDAVYIRGAMTLHLLRRTIGDAAFFRLLQDWAATKHDSIASTAQFESFAQSYTSIPLTPLFDDWLHTSGKPTRMDYGHP